MSDWVEGPPPNAPGRFYPVGMLLQLHDGTRVLIGHVNSLGGVCDDCTYDVDPEEIAYHRVIWEEGDDG